MNKLNGDKFDNLDEVHCQIPTTEAHQEEIVKQIRPRFIKYVGFVVKSFPTKETWGLNGFTDEF